MKKLWTSPFVLFLREAIMLYFSRRVPQAAACLAYFVLLTVFPVLICVSYILGMVNIDIVSLMDQLQPLLPEAALDVLEGDQKDLADTFAGGKAQTIGDYNNAFMQLESGAVDAVACDLSIADYQMAAKPDMFVKLEPLSTENYAVGFAKDGDTAMIDAVNKTLKEMYDDGTIAKLCEKWGEYGISIDNWVLVD